MISRLITKIWHGYSHAICQSIFYLLYDFQIDTKIWQGYIHAICQQNRFFIYYLISRLIPRFGKAIVMLFAIDFLFILLTVRTTLQFTLICGQGQNRGALKCRP